MPPPCSALQFDFLVERRLAEQLTQLTERSLFRAMTALLQRFPHARKLIKKQWLNQWNEAGKRASNIHKSRWRGGRGRAGRQGVVVMGAWRCDKLGCVAALPLPLALG